MVRNIFIFLFTVSMFSISKAQMTVAQMHKIGKTPMIEITALLKDYGYNIAKIYDKNLEYFNDKNIIENNSFFMISGETISSEKPKIIQYVIEKYGFISTFENQLQELKYSFDDLKSDQNIVSKIWRKNNEEFRLKLDVKNNLLWIIYITNNN